MTRPDYPFTGRCVSRQRLNLRIDVSVDGIPERSLGRACDGSEGGIDAVLSTTGAWNRRVVPEHMTGDWRAVFLA
jgi:hypothetical protein